MSKGALYYIVETVRSMGDGHWCEFTTPWVSGYPEQLSMAVDKGGQYRDALKYQILRVMERGTLDVVTARSVNEEPSWADIDNALEQTPL